MKKTDSFLDDYEFNKSFIDSIPISISFWTQNAEPVLCNKSFLSLLNVESLEFFSERIDEFMPPFQPDGNKTVLRRKYYFEQALKLGNINFEWVFKSSDGKVLPLFCTVVCIDYQGEPLLAVFLRDNLPVDEIIEKSITTYKQTQKIYDLAPICISIFDEDFQVVDCNQKALELFNCKNKKEILDNYFRFSPIHQANGRNTEELYNEYMTKAFNEGYAKFDWLYRTKSGELIPSEVTLVKTLEGDISLIFCYIHDLREIIKSQAQIVEVEKRTQIMLDATPLSVNYWVKEEHGDEIVYRTVDCNYEAIKLFNVPNKQEYLDNFFEFSPIYQPNGLISEQEAKKNLETAFSQGYIKFSWIHQTQKGELIPSEVVLIRVNSEDDIIVISYIRDLRELKESQRKAKDAEERIQIMLEALPMGADIWDDNYKLIDCNVESIRLTGCKTKKEYLEKFSREIINNNVDEINFENKFFHELKKAFNVGYTTFETTLNDCFAKKIPVEINAIRVRIGNSYMVAVYIRDLRELKAMLSEIKIAEKKLEAAKNEALRNDKAKSEFLANMSHEIRTSMNGILGLLHLLSKTELVEKQEEYVKNSIGSAGNLMRIINDILDFSKIEAGKLELENTPFMMSDVCKEMKNLFSQKAEEKNLNLFITPCEYDQTYMIGDQLRLKQVLFNLVSNAIKFTNSGSVTFGWSVEECPNNKMNNIFFIKDTGIGLTNEQANRLFSAFTQADNTVSRKYGGTGLGLTISKKLVEMMGGNIWIKSEINKGSTFYFTTVFEKYVPSEEEQLAKQKNKVDLQTIIRRGKILLVEDNKINQIIAVELLKKVGFTVDIANNGQEALDMLDKSNYNAILMDIQMPVMDGHTAAKKIRKNIKYDHIPIIAMSAHALVGDKEISLDSGMNDHITKPISPDILYTALDYWLEKFNK